METLTQRSPSELPATLTHRPAALLGQLLTRNAAMGLLHMVEPQGRQVEHLTGLHRAAKSPGLTVTGVPGQIRSQRVQWDPGYLGTQWMPGSRSKAPRPCSSVPSKGKAHEPGPVQHWESPNLGIVQSQMPSPQLHCACSSETSI